VSDIKQMRCWWQRTKTSYSTPHHWPNSQFVALYLSVCGRWLVAPGDWYGAWCLVTRDAFYSPFGSFIRDLIGSKWCSLGRAFEFRNWVRDSDNILLQYYCNALPQRVAACKRGQKHSQQNNLASVLTGKGKPNYSIITGSFILAGSFSII
jgi:hypothetical protein